MYNDRKMLELKPGDIILARGSKLRHKLMQLFSGLKFNHALIYYGSGETQELNSHGVQRKLFDDAYLGRKIVVFRLRNIDVVVDSRRWAAFRNTMDELRESGLDIVGVAMMALRLPTYNRLRNGTSYLCNKYVEEIYRRAKHNFDRCDFRKVPDVESLMRDKYTARELLLRYNLVKIWDYRWT